jgi:hypothetical protein
VIEDQDASVLIGTPLIGRPCVDFVESMLALTKPAKCDWVHVDNRNCDVARNEIVKKCLEGGWDWLFMVDGDMSFRPETMVRLNSRDKKLISGLCFTRVRPVAPTCYRGIVRYDDDGWPFLRVHFEETTAWLEKNAKHLHLDQPAVILPDQPGALVKYDSTGGACVMIHRTVLEAIEPPWFEYTKPDRMVGEDFYFYQKAKQAGFQLWMDRTVIVGHHYGNQYIGAVDYVTHQYATRFQAMPKALKWAALAMRRLGLG